MLDEVERLIDEEVERYFTEILPRRIDADFRGNGYEMLWRMLDAHDRRDLAISTKAPTAKALAMAARVRAACPAVISPDLLPGDDGGVLLGRFTQSTMARGLAVSSMRGVEIFPRAFLLLGEADQRGEIALTIFHEYIHYFESFLLRREQPLRGREVRDGQLEVIDLAEARRRDRKHARWRIAKWGLLGAAAVGLFAAILVWQLDGHGTREVATSPPVTAEDTARMLAHDAEVARALHAHVDEIVAKQLGPKEAIALVGTPPTVAFGPGHESPVVRSDQLDADPQVAHARGGLPDAQITLLWGFEISAYPPRLVGVAWPATGALVRIDAVVSSVRR